MLNTWNLYNVISRCYLYFKKCHSKFYFSAVSFTKKPLPLSPFPSQPVSPELEFLREEEWCFRGREPSLQGHGKWPACACHSLSPARRATPMPHLTQRWEINYQWPQMGFFLMYVVLSKNSTNMTKLGDLKKHGDFPCFVRSRSSGNCGSNAYNQGRYSAGVRERMPVHQQASMKIGWAYVLINWASDQIG